MNNELLKEGATRRRATRRKENHIVNPGLPTSDFWIPTLKKKFRIRVKSN